MNYPPEAIQLFKSDRIYLMSPYSHEDIDIEESRFFAAIYATGALLKKGLTVFSPISHSHIIARRCAIDGRYDTWQNLDYSFIYHWATFGLVLELDGHDKSTGVQDETFKLLEMDIPVYGVKPNEVESVIAI